MDDAVLPSLRPLHTANRRHRTRPSGSGGKSATHIRTRVRARQTRCRDGPGVRGLRGALPQPIEHIDGLEAWVRRGAGRHSGPCPRRARSWSAQARPIARRPAFLGTHAGPAVMGGERAGNDCEETGLAGSRLAPTRRA
ncbi:unnamed protein product [Ectocarpus fasciculatus]